MKIKQTIVYVSLLAAPVAHAQVGNIRDGFEWFLGLLNTLLPLLIVLALAYLTWGIVKYIAAGGDAETRGESRKFVVNAVIYLFVITSIWGIVNVLSSTFSFSTSVPVVPNVLQPPTAP